MSGKYKKRTRGYSIYDPNSKDNFPISRSRLDSFKKCSKCFYMDRRLGVDRPSGYPFSLNLAVDELVKKEFDIHRSNQTIHPLLSEYKISNLVPFNHQNIEQWRSKKPGIYYDVPSTNIRFFGSIDDAWIDPLTNEITLIDYKATSTSNKLEIYDDYEKQAEMYQWLFRKNGFKVSNTFLFVYFNGIKDSDSFNNTLKFEASIIKHEGNDSWVEQALLDAYKCLQSDSIPKPSSDCGHCQYIQDFTNFTKV